MCVIVYVYTVCMYISSNIDWRANKAALVLSFNTFICFFKNLSQMSTTNRENLKSNMQIILLGPDQYAKKHLTNVLVRLSVVINSLKNIFCHLKCSCNHMITSWQNAKLQVNQKMIWRKDGICLMSKCQPKVNFFLHHVCTQRWNLLFIFRQNFLQWWNTFVHLSLSVKCFPWSYNKNQVSFLYGVHIPCKTSSAVKKKLRPRMYK